MFSAQNANICSLFKYANNLYSIVTAEVYVPTAKCLFLWPAGGLLQGYPERRKVGGRFGSRRAVYV